MIAELAITGAAGIIGVLVQEIRIQIYKRRVLRSVHNLEEVRDDLAAAEGDLAILDEESSEALARARERLDSTRARLQTAEDDLAQALSLGGPGAGDRLIDRLRGPNQDPNRSGEGKGSLPD